MLPFLEELLEKKLSEVLGADVTFDRVKLSPLSGKVEVLNLKATLPFSTTPFLSVPRIEAKIAMARALKQEISVQSLRVERPAARLPLPRLAKGHAERKASDASPAKPWQFEADDVLVVDAAIEFQQGDYHLIADGVTLSLKRDASAIVLSLVASSVRRVSPTVDLGELKLTGQVATRDFTQLMTAAVTLDGELGTTLRVHAQTDSLQSKTIDAQIAGDVDSQLVSRMIDPSNIRIPAIAGAIHLDIDGVFSPKKITLRRGEISARNATIDLKSSS